MIALHNKNLVTPVNMRLPDQSKLDTEGLGGIFLNIIADIEIRMRLFFVFALRKAKTKILFANADLFGSSHPIFLESE